MKIICSGPNYSNHFEMNSWPKEPQFFVKTSNSVCETGTKVSIPFYATYLLGEAELVLVIGKSCKKVNEINALNYVSHYTVANDITAPEVLNSDLQWIRAKCADGFCPVGTYISGLPSDQSILRTYINNVLQQEFSISEMIFKPAQLIAHLSQYIQLDRGDIILTGSKKGPVKITSGDVVRVTIDELVYCENKFM